MNLIYCYIKKFRNIIEQEVQFSDEWECHFEDGKLLIKSKVRSTASVYLYGNGCLRDCRVIVGKTGSGKTNLLQMIGMSPYVRSDSVEKGDGYMMLYKDRDDSCFIIEYLNIEIQGITDTNDKYLYQDARYAKAARFEFDQSRQSVNNPRPLSRYDQNDTFIVNSFDRYSFSYCPYEDERQEGIHHNDELLPRIVTQFGKSSITLEYNNLKSYIQSFPDDSIKRNVALEIRWDNWQHRNKVVLDEVLINKEYWTYVDKRLSARFDGKYKHPEKSTPKSRFIHDLMTDFAIYLRKWAECVDLNFPEMCFDCFGSIHDLGIRHPDELPDGKKMGILKRIDWLCQYLDYYTDGVNSNKGLIWQIGSDIRDLFSILNRMPDKYFTDEKFSIPVLDIDMSDGQPISDLFERMDQYRPDQVGLFTDCLLPYHWMCISSGEYQYAKIWGIVEEYCVRMKVIEQGQSFKDAKHPNIILLIDEPENYMHPEMCRNFINNLQRLLSDKTDGRDIQVIITTHSPFILSDMLTEQVIRMTYDDKGHCIICPSGKPLFAANIYSIMADSFFLDYTIGEVARQFLYKKIKILDEMASRKYALTQQDQKEIEGLKQLLPQIGDDLIKHHINLMITRLQ